MRCEEKPKRVAIATLLGRSDPDPDRSMVQVQLGSLAVVASPTWPALVWFPDPSVMRMRGRGKKNIDKQASV